MTGLGLAILGTADPARADTLHVPSARYPTVQAALDAAESREGADTVSLAAGTYRQNVTVKRQRVAIVAPAGPAQTVLDATGRGESAMRIIGGNVTVRGLRITGGTGTGSGVRLGGGVQIISPVALPPADAKFANCVIAGNSVLDPGSVGGGVFVHEKTSATFDDCVIEDNRAGEGGGGIFASVGSTIRVNGGAIRDNRAGLRSTRGAGGAIAAGDADLFVRGTAITGNTSTAAGGGIHAINQLSTTERTLAMSDCTVAGNTTASGPPSGGQDDQGGGIHVEDRVSLVMTNCAVSDNTADSGGGISSFRASLTVTDSVIAGNEATNPQGVGGGGVMSIGAQTALPGRCPVVRLTRTAVVGNVAADRGGGILSGEGAGCGGEQNGVARLEVADSTVAENTTGSGRGGGGVIATNTALAITDSHVNANEVGGGGVGGGILLSQGPSSATIARTTIAGNTTPESAAGIFVTGGGSPTLNLTDSFLYANRSQTPDPNRGGGLVLNLEGGPGAIVDGVVRGNVIADNSSWQITEQEFGRSNLVYSENEFGDPAPGNANLIYRSTGTAPNPAFSDVADFNAATLGTPDRTHANTERAPDFTSFLAAPARFVPAAPGSAYLSWSAARADSVTLAGSPAARPETDTAAVAGGACDQDRTFELQVDRGAGPVAHRVTVEGVPCTPQPDCPAGTSSSVTCFTDGRGRLVFAGTRVGETLVGSGGADVLNGGGGADRLTGRAGEDGFAGGRGKDRINSKGQRGERVGCGPGRDRVRGARGDRVKRDCEKVRR